ncbi:hypothetical protein V3C99_007273 [Haemonchus contortus]
MAPNILSTAYQVFYIVIPTISLIGNAAIVYVTVRSRSLRSPCNILIGLISLGELVHMFGHYIMVASHNIIENHLMRQDLCGYWQLLPLTGMFFASTLLLNTAIDRLLSTRKFYNPLIKTQYYLYTSVHIGVGLAVAVGMEAMIFSNSTSDLYILCVITAPLLGRSRTPYFLIACSTDFFVLVCYLLLVILLRKTRLSQESSKQIYRSVAVISVTAVFGYFSATAITSLDIILHLDYDKMNLTLFAGVLVNFTCAANFFIYYFISKIYRREFDQYLFIGILKKAVNCGQIPRIHGWASAR